MIGPDTDFGLMSRQISLMTTEEKTEWESSMSLPIGTIDKILDVAQKLVDYVEPIMNAGEELDMEEVSTIVEEMDGIFGVPPGTSEGCTVAVGKIMEIYEAIATHIALCSKEDPGYDHEKDPTVILLETEVENLKPMSKIEDHIRAAQALRVAL